MPHLLHFSEDPKIKVFRPHVPQVRRTTRRWLWAWTRSMRLDSGSPGTRHELAAGVTASRWSEIGRALLGMGAHRRMHAIETVWLERMQACKMYMYRFDPAPFAAHNSDAGYYSTRETITPLSVEPIGDLLALHAGANIELRIVPNLWPIIDAVVASGLEFSIIRKMNASPR